VVALQKHARTSWTTTDELQYPANGSRYGDQPANSRSRQWLDVDILDANIASLRAVPTESVGRRAVSWDGIRAEIILTNGNAEVGGRAAAQGGLK
jgi:hypothetical protein